MKPNDSVPAKEGQKKLLAGKYNSQEDLEQGYLNDQEEKRRMKARLDQVEAENRALQLAGQKTQPEPDADVEALKEAGFDTEVLGRFVTKHGRAAGMAGAQEAVSPFIKAAVASQGIPMELQSKASALLAQDEETAETYNILVEKNPTRAASYLVSQVRAHDAEAGMHAEGEANKQKRIEQRTTAGLPPSQSGQGDENADEAEAAASKRKGLIDEGLRRGGVTKAIASEFLKGRIKIIDRLDEPPRVI